MEELTFRRIIEILIEQKKYIVIPVVFIAIAVYVTMFHIIPPVYVAESVININNFSFSTYSGKEETNLYLSNGDLDIEKLTKLDKSNSEDSNILLSSLFEQARLNEEAYIQKMKDHVIIEAVVETLKGEANYTITELEQKLEISNVQNVFTISVSDSSPELASKIANTYVDTLKTQMADFYTSNLGKLSNYLDNMIKSKETEIKEMNTLAAKYSTEKDNSMLSSLAVKQNITNQIYETLLFKREQVELLSAVDFNNMYFTVIRRADQPVEPSNKQKYLILLLSVVFTLTVSIVAIYFKEYWEKSKPEK